MRKNGVAVLTVTCLSGGSGTTPKKFTVTGSFAFATGDPGDVYVCHPFLVHAAQLNRRGRPRLRIKETSKSFIQIHRMKSMLR